MTNLVNAGMVDPETAKARMRAGEVFYLGGGGSMFYQEGFDFPYRFQHQGDNYATMAIRGIWDLIEEFLVDTEAKVISRKGPLL
jgi:hypothetical protein